MTEQFDKQISDELERMHENYQHKKIANMIAEKVQHLVAENQEIRERLGKIEEGGRDEK